MGRMLGEGSLIAFSGGNVGHPHWLGELGHTMSIKLSLRRCNPCVPTPGLEVERAHG
jgi:hypothetical protein